MKNLTRVLALVLVFSLMLSTVAFAAFTDVKADDDYAEAIETLAALGIIKGYEDGTFGADKAITRAEAVAIVNRIQNLSAASAGAQGASLYTDVAASHWALGDINLATQMGTVSGDGNGTFRPEDQVSYQEMVKMLVVALGYAPAAADMGGWPTGYLVVASQYGVLEDTANMGAAPATRGVVAQLTFNALTAPMMKQTGYGENKEYTVMDAEGATETLLTQKLDIYKVAVTPVANDAEAIDGAVQEAGYVAVDYADDDPWFGVKAPKGVDKKLLKGDSDIDAKLGYAAVAYIKKNADKEWEVLYSAIEDGKTIVVEIDPATIADVIAEDEVSGIIEIEDEDAGIEEEYEYDKDTKVIIDGAKAVAFNTKLEDAFKYDDYNWMEGTVTMLFDKNEDAAKYIFVKTYKTDMVEEINPSATKIYLKEGAAINLDEDDVDNLVYTITLDGKAIDVADIQEDDIITYRTANEKKFYEIIVTRATIEGTIDAIGSDDEGKFYNIGGEKYRTSVSGYAAGLENKMPTAPGAAGTFYLDAFGKIAYYNRTSTAGATDRDYAYVISVGADTTAFGAALKVKLLDAEGNINTYTVADKFTAYNIVLDGEDFVEEETVEGGYDVYTGATIDAALYQKAEDGTESGLFAGLKDAVIGYTVSSNGELAEIAIATTNNYKYNDDDAFNKISEEITGAYDLDNLKLAGYYVTEDTLVFYVGDGSASEEDFAIVDYTVFEDEDDYTFNAYVVNDDKEVKVLVLRTALSTGNAKGNIALFTDYSEVKNEDGKTVSSITFIEGGEVKTVLCERKSESAFKLDKATVFEYELNDKNEVKSVSAIFAATDKAEDINAGDYMKKDIDDPYYVVGQVYSKSGTSLKLGDFVNDAFDTHKIPGDANVYMVDNTGSKVKISVSELGEISGNKFDKKTGKLYGTDEADNYYVVVKYVEEVATDVVIYKNFLNKK